MNSSNGINRNNERTKMRAPIPVAGAIVTAAILLSGLTLIVDYQQSVLGQEQQQNMTGVEAEAGGNATNATMTGARGNAPSWTGGEGTTTAGVPATGEGEGSGGGAAGSGGTAPTQ